MNCPHCGHDASRHTQFEDLVRNILAAAKDHPEFDTVSLSAQDARLLEQHGLKLTRDGLDTPKP